MDSANINIFLLQGDSDFCLLLALPCGRDQDDVLNQTQALKAAFINYLQTKLAAGIINIPNPGSNQVRHDCLCKVFSLFSCFFFPVFYFFILSLIMI